MNAIWSAAALMPLLLIRRRSQSGVAAAALHKTSRACPRSREHTIRDARDYVRHFDYIHWNPVKHGLVKRVKDWPWSTVHRYLHMGEYDETWCGRAIRPRTGVTLPQEVEYFLAE